MKKPLRLAGVLACATLLAACGESNQDNTPKITAEGTAETRHADSVTLTALYQEYSNNDVKIYVVSHACQQAGANELFTINGKIAYSTEDGDKVAKLTCSTYTLARHAKSTASDAIKEAIKKADDPSEKELTGEHKGPFTAYPEASGEYDMAFSFNYVSGPATKEFAFTVSPTSNPTNATTWAEALYE